MRPRDVLDSPLVAGDILRCITTKYPRWWTIGKPYVVYDLHGTCRVRDDDGDWHIIEFAEATFEKVVTEPLIAPKIETTSGIAAAKVGDWLVCQTNRWNISWWTIGRAYEVIAYPRHIDLIIKDDVSDPHFINCFREGMFILETQAIAEPPAPPKRKSRFIGI